MVKRNCTQEPAVRVSSVPGLLCEGPVLQAQSHNELGSREKLCSVCGKGMSDGIQRVWYRVSESTCTCLFHA